MKQSPACCLGAKAFGAYTRHIILRIRSMRESLDNGIIDELNNLWVDLDIDNCIDNGVITETAQRYMLAEIEHVGNSEDKEPTFANPPPTGGFLEKGIAMSDVVGPASKNNCDGVREVPRIRIKRNADGSVAIQTADPNVSPNACPDVLINQPTFKRRRKGGQYTKLTNEQEENIRLMHHNKYAPHRICEMYHIGKKRFESIIADEFTHYEITAIDALSSIKK